MTRNNRVNLRRVNLRRQVSSRQRSGAVSTARSIRHLVPTLSDLAVRLWATMRVWPREVWVALAVGVVAVGLRLNGLGLPIDNYDDGVYIASLQSLASGHALYAQVYCGQPPLFLLLLLPWYRLLGMTIFAARFGVVVYSLIGVGAMGWLGYQLGGRRVGLIALALLAFDPLYLAQSRTVQAEAPALAFGILAVAIAASVRAVPDLRRAALSGAALGIGCMIKLFVLPAIIPIGAFLLAPFWAELVGTQIAARRWPTRMQLAPPLRASWPTIAASGGSFLAVGLLAFVSQPNLGAEWAQVIGLHATATSALAAQRGANIGVFLHIWWDLPLFAAGIAAAVLGWRQGWWEPVVFAVWGAVCVLALALQTPLFDHHMALLPPAFIPSAALLGEMGWRGMESDARRRRAGRGRLKPRQERGRLKPRLGGLRATKPAYAGWVVANVALLVLLIALGKSVGQEIAAQKHPPTGLIQAANDVQVLTLPGDLVVTDAQSAVVQAGREVPASVVDTSQVRIATGALTTAQVIAAASDPRVTAILWYSGRFDRLVGLRDWVNRHFMPAVKYGDDHFLYVRVAPTSPPTG